MVRTLISTVTVPTVSFHDARFREDLYYRNVVNIEIPPLRARREAIPALVEHLIRLHNHRLKKSVKGADSATLRLLMSLPLKGNVRELDNILEHAMTLGDTDWITVRDLPRTIQSLSRIAQQDPVRSDTDNLCEALRTCEREHISAVQTESTEKRRDSTRRRGDHRRVHHVDPEEVWRGAGRGVVHLELDRRVVAE